MARRRYGRQRRGHGMKLPVISLAILGLQVAYANAQGGADIWHKVGKFAQLYTGFDADGNFYAPAMALGYGPWLVKRFVLPIARPRMPVRGLPISLS